MSDSEFILKPVKEKKKERTSKKNMGMKMDRWVKKEDEMVYREKRRES